MQQPKINTLVYHTAAAVQTSSSVILQRTRQQLIPCQTHRMVLSHEKGNGSGPRLPPAEMYRSYLIFLPPGAAPLNRFLGLAHVELGVPQEGQHHPSAVPADSHRLQRRYVRLREPSCLPKASYTLWSMSLLFLLQHSHRCCFMLLLVLRMLSLRQKVFQHNLLLTF